MRATSLVLIGVSQIHVVLNILINRNYSYCNTMYKWINKRFCLSVCLSVQHSENTLFTIRRHLSAMNKVVVADRKNAHACEYCVCL